MTCSRCGSDRLYQFEASKRARARPVAAQLPLVCRNCGLITVDGVPVNLPEKLEEQAKEMAEQAELSAKQAREELEKDPDQMIETYMANHYRSAYMDGFFRALAFFSHEGKEGRIRRLRTLWKSGFPVEDIELCGMMMAPDAYTEFEQLLYLGVKMEAPSGESASNQSPSVQEGPSSLPR